MTAYCLNINCSNFNVPIDVPIIPATFEQPSEPAGDCCERCGHEFMDQQVDTERLLEVIEDEFGYLHNFHIVDEDALIKAIANELIRQRREDWKMWREGNHVD